MTNYSFLTNDSFRIDATAKTPNQGYKIAKIQADKYNKVLSGTYFKYDRDGLHAVNGVYKQIRGTK